MKRKMTQQQEFEIMKLVYDKFLWLGFGVMLFGMYQLISQNNVNGAYYLLMGMSLLLFFAFNIKREYQHLV